MRILSISGQNIASLAARFTLDFTAPPLAGAGLFAITGETGAGKSSILDTMCLALYGTAPRLTGGAASDVVPDASGTELRASDARSLLHRGAAQGWAEVRFTAKDGQDYIANWTARRSRDRSDGAWQAIARKLIRLEDGQVLASQTTQVNTQIQELTGFTSDEFRRSVLLAQGDFDAFLRADTNERAALLEKVTGSDVYRAISKRIFERNKSAKQAKDLLAERLGEHEVLPPEALAALRAEQQKNGLQIVDLAITIKAQHEEISQHQRRTKAQQELDKAASSLALAQSNLDAAQNDRAELALFDALAPLQAPWSDLQDCKARLKAAEHGLKEKAENLALQEGITQAQSLKTHRAEAENNKQEEQFKRFGPIWSAAADLDSRIDTAAKEVQETQHKLTEVTEIYHLQAADFDKIEAEFKNLAAQKEILSNQLGGMAQDQLLARNWPEISLALQESLSAQAERVYHARELDQLLSLERDAQNRLELTQKSIAQSLERNNLLRDKYLKTNAEIEALVKAHPADRPIILAEVSAMIDRMEAVQSEVFSLGTEFESLSQQCQNTQNALEKTAEDIGVAEGLSKAANLRQSILQAPTQRALMAASEAAQNLRLTLENGCPCPVCGAKEHPISADHALMELAQSLKADLARASDEATQAQDNLLAHLGQKERLSTLAEQLALQKAEVSRRILQQNRLWQELREKAISNPLCPPLPMAPVPHALPSLKEAQLAEKIAQSHIFDLRQEALLCQNKREDQDQIHRALLQDLDAIRQTQSKGAQLQAEHRSKKAAAEAVIYKRRLTLEPWLQDQTLSAPLAENLKARSRIVIEIEEKISKIEADHIALIPQLARAQSQKEAAEKQLQDAHAQCATREGNLQQLQEQRALLLDGVPTSEHRSAQNLLRQAAQQAYQTAAEVLRETSSARASAFAHWQAAQSARDEAADRLFERQKAFNLALWQQNLTEAEIETLLERAHSQSALLREKLQALDQALQQARSDLALRQEDLTLSPLPSAPLQTLQERLSQLQEQENALQQRLGALAETIAQDDLKRIKIKGLEDEIEQARLQAEVWAAVNAAAGSQNGDSFARIAQSITLDVLIEHANHHLADLNPRYRLRAGVDLALQVEDLDMGGEARATRSLSGGERFLVSLALALALSHLGGKGGISGTLFIDEGFGSLDPVSLNQAIDALEVLQSQGRQIGVISHVEAMKERISTRIALRKLGSGRSVIEIQS